MTEANSYPMRIVQNPYHPTVQKGTYTVRSKGHPLLYWLARQLAKIGIKFEPDVVWQVPRLLPAPMLLLGDTIYCAPSQYIDMMQQVRTHQPTATRYQ